jgi:tRNA (guanosine-2'-O-)-methyltransferase
MSITRHTSISECYSELRKQNFRIYTTHLSATAQSIYDVDFTKPTAIVFGNEHSGVSAEALDTADSNILIPQVGMVRSLNISVACAVTLFEAMRQRRERGMYNESALSAEEQERILLYWLSK